MKMKRPTIVCLCGSTRFGEMFAQANLIETLAGKIVLTIGCDMRSDSDLFGHLSAGDRAQLKGQLDELHLHKIDLADEVLILDVDGYIGESTRRELEYARRQRKRIRFLELPQDNQLIRVGDSVESARSDTRYRLPLGQP